MTVPDPTPSPALRKKARDLGIEFNEYTSTEELGKLVSSKRLTAPPTRGQLKVARDLGVSDYDNNTTSAEMDGMIRDARIARSREVLASNPQIAEGNFLVHEGVLIEVRNISKTSYSVQMRRVITPQGRHDSYARYAYELAGVRPATPQELRSALQKLRSSH